jgi:hypothetical protein
MLSDLSHCTETKIQKRLIERQLEDAEIDQLACMAVAGIAAEGQKYPEVMGQNADLLDLQRIILRGKSRLSDSQQQNLTVGYLNLHIC